MVSHQIKHVDVLGSRMAYIEAGEGPTVIFQHGNPTSSYLWRHVIPYVAPHARCIAPDLIGMGASDKPNISYRVEDHARYFEALIEALDLEHVVLVLHDWGSAIGLDWARRHEERVRGLALMEFVYPIPTWLDIPSGARESFQAFRSNLGRKLLIDENRFVEEVLPAGVVRSLTDEEMQAYRAPFLDPAAREPVYRFPNEVPIAGAPVDTWALVQAYCSWLTDTETPKLLFHADPGAFIPPALAAKLRAEWKNCSSISLGAGRHFVQEDHADLIGRSIAEWLPSLLPEQLAVK